MQSGLVSGILVLLAGLFAFLDMLAARREASAVEDPNGIEKASAIRRRQTRSAVFGVLFILGGLYFIVKAYWF